MLLCQIFSFKINIFVSLVWGLTGIQKLQAQTISANYFLNNCFIVLISTCPVAEFKEFERRFKFKPRLKYGWFHLNLYQMFQDLSRRLI